MERTDEFELTESKLKMPEPDRRKQLIQEIGSLCEQFIKVTRDLHNETNERKIGRLEERWFTLRREIVDKQAAAYLDEGIYIEIGCSDKLAPIRVHKDNRMLPWGRVAD